jgi:hypothetical protein
MNLPKWLVCGAQRSGSSSLWMLLQQHPQIFVPASTKEINFFSHEFDRGIPWYSSLFENARPDQMPGEVSPYYLIRSDITAPRIASTLPDAKLIFVLRNPVDRALSMYRFDVGRGKYSDVYAKSFEEILEEPVGRSYIANGEYARLLTPFVEHFSREQILVLVSETFFRNVRTEMNRVYAFLGLPPVATVPEWINSARVLRWKRLSPLLRPLRENALIGRSPARIRRAAVGLLYSKSPKPETLDPATRTRLAKHYAPHNERLAELLGLDLSAWDNGSKGESMPEASRA